MANPPITIGPFTTVPAPGSPIQSSWTQQISHFVWDARARIIDTTVGGGNITGTVQIGSLALPAAPGYAQRIFLVMALSLTGHSAAGTIQPRWRTAAGAEFAVGPITGYAPAAQGLYGTGPTMFSVVDRNSNAPAETIQAWVVVAGAGGNTNIGGSAYGLIVPA